MPLIRRLIPVDTLGAIRASVGRTAGVVTVVVAVALFLALSLFPASEKIFAGPGPKIVRGYVYDLVGNPVAGANVTVVDRNSSATQWYDASDADGFYTVTFGAFDWDLGHIFDVTAKYLTDQATNSSGYAGPEPIEYVNVTIGSLTIPEFGALLGSPLAFVSLGMIALFIVIRRRVSK